MSFGYKRDFGNVVNSFTIYHKYWKKCEIDGEFFDNVAFLYRLSKISFRFRSRLRKWNEKTQSWENKLNDQR